MPMSPQFRKRLQQALPQLIAKHGTPFHLYDEVGIRETAAELISCMPPNFGQFFAVKALPDPAILRLMANDEFGFDCSSEAELRLVERTIGPGARVFFTSNNTTHREFDAALRMPNAIINLDDVCFLKKEPMQSRMPKLICFRLNPGDRQTGNVIIGTPENSKYGITWEQLVPAYAAARRLGAARFGLHTMVVSNNRDYTHALLTVDLLFEAAAQLKAELGITLEFINIGGGMGIPYHPDDVAFDLKAFGAGLQERLAAFEKKHGFVPRIFTENGRFMTGPHGVLVTRAINRMEKYKLFVGVEVAMPALMRPAMYGAYHHIEVVDGKTFQFRGAAIGDEEEEVSIVGPICENTDRLATDRHLPIIHADEEDGDLIIAGDTGAHGAAMGFNYNGRPRIQGILLRPDGSSVLTRRGETVSDLLHPTKGL